MSQEDEYISTLGNIFSNLVRAYNRFQLTDHSLETLNDGKEILKRGVKVVCTIKEHIKAFESVLSDCQDFIKEIEDDLSEEPKEEDFVYSTKHGMLSYRGRDFIPTDKEPHTNRVKGIRKPQVSEQVFIEELGYYMKLPTIKNIRDIPPMLYWYNGDSTYSKGVYCCIVKGVYTRIPFPEITDSTKDHTRDRSVKCKYHRKEDCDVHRIKMAKLHNSVIRVCNFAHEGDHIVKIGYPARCIVPSFGNPATFKNDINNVTLDSIKVMLMYGLNDIMVSAIWLDCKKIKDVVYDKLDIA